MGETEAHVALVQQPLDQLGVEENDLPMRGVCSNLCPTAEPKKKSEFQCPLCLLPAKYWQASGPSSETIESTSDAIAQSSPGSVGPEVRDGRIRPRVHASKHGGGALGGLDGNSPPDERQQREKHPVIVRPSFSHEEGEKEGETLQHRAADDERKTTLP